MAMVYKIINDMQTKNSTLITNTLAEIQISYSCNVPKDKRQKIQRSSDAEKILRKIWESNTIEYRETFYVLYLNRANEVIGYFLHSIGGLAGTIVDAKQVLGVALKANASRILISHNHPSNSLQPSNQDIEITKKIVNGASYLDITVLDHLFLAANNYYSFADEGIMPTGAKNGNMHGAETLISYQKKLYE